LIFEFGGKITTYRNIIPEGDLGDCYRIPVHAYISKNYIRRDLVLLKNGFDEFPDMTELILFHDLRSTEAFLS
jgi:hypothetical protein